MKWKTFSPNEHGDWISLRNNLFTVFIPMEPEKKFDFNTKSFFITNAIGVVSARDAWVYNSSKNEIEINTQCFPLYYYEEKQNLSLLTITTTINTSVAMA